MILDDIFPAVVPGRTGHRRAYHGGRGYWSCEAAGWGPCEGHAEPSSPAPTRQRAFFLSERGCIHGHPADRMRVYINTNGWRTRTCLECNLRKKT